MQAFLKIQPHHDQKLSSASATNRSRSVPAFAQTDQSVCRSSVLVFVLVCITLCPFHFCNHLDQEERCLLYFMVMFIVYFVTFPCGIPGQVWYLIVSFPDLCRLSYFDGRPMVNHGSNVYSGGKLILCGYAE